LFTAIGFPAAGSGRIGKRQKEKQYTTKYKKHRIHTIENKQTKQENKHKTDIKQHEVKYSENNKKKQIIMK
jgi:hypothetical protein